MGLAVVKPSLPLLADGAMCCAIQKRHTAVRHLSVAGLMHGLSILGVIHLVLVCVPNVFAQFQPHSSAAVVPFGIPAVFASDICMSRPRSMPGSSLHIAYSVSSCARSSAVLRAAAFLAACAVSGCGDPARYVVIGAVASGSTSSMRMERCARGVGLAWQGS